MNNKLRNDEDYSSSDKLVQNSFIVDKNCHIDDDQSSTSTKGNTPESCHRADECYSDDENVIGNLDNNYPHSTSHNPTSSLTITTNTNDNTPKPANDNYDWIVTDTNNRSQLDQGSGSTATSDKSLIHNYVNFSTIASLPTFHGIYKMSHKTDR